VAWIFPPIGGKKQRHGSALIGAGVNRVQSTRFENTQSLPKNIINDLFCKVLNIIM
jgi:hypothetical protein